MHIVKDGKSLKVWLERMEVARNVGYTDREIERVLAVIAEHREEWMEAWNGFFGI